MSGRNHFLLALLVICATAVFPSTLLAETIRVPTDQPTIQAGIAAAATGDTVLAASGNYPENIDFLGKAITVTSESGALHSIINPDPGQGSVVVFINGEGPDSVLEGFTIRNGSGTGASYPSGGGIYCDGSSPQIIANRIIANDVGSGRGGGIYCSGGAPLIIDNLVRDNSARSGGGIYCYQSPARFEGNTISRNTADGGQNSLGVGGGITITGSGSAENPVQLVNNLIVDNLAHAWNTYPDNFSAYGGGITIGSSSVSIDHCTIAHNWADTMYHGPTYGGGMCLACGAVVTVSNSIFYFDQAVVVGGYELAIVCDQEPYSTIAFEYSDVQYGPGTFYVSDPGNTYQWGEGMGTDNPRFVHDQPYYLAQVASGQPWNSPCVDAGDPAGHLVPGSTRTDSWPDQGITDMGFHYPSGGAGLVISGPGPAPDNPPLVRVFPAGEGAEPWYEFDAYGTPAWGVNVAAAELDGFAGPSLLTGPGPGAVFGPHVRGFALDGTPLTGLSFFAYGTLKFGVNVAAGDFDNDGADEIVTGAGPGAVFGPHVRAFRYRDQAVAAIAGVSFFAYGTLKYGVNVACGDLDGDLRDEIVTGAGPGVVFGPHVRGWDIDADQVSAIPGVSYFAYGTPRYGVRVACGDVDGDGLEEIITAPGPSSQFGAHIRGWDFDGSGVVAMPGISFFAWPPEQLGHGAHIACGTDLDADGRDDILVAPGPDPTAGSPVQAYGYHSGQAELIFSFPAYEDLSHGANLATGSVDGAQRSESRMF